MEKLVLHVDAPAYYKNKNFESFISQNLDLVDEAKNTLAFIEENIGKELFNNDDCEDSSDYYRVSRYEWKKIFEIPKICFETIENNENDIIEAKEEKIIPKIKMSGEKIIIAILFITFIFQAFYNPGQKQVEASVIDVKSEFEILTEKQSENLIKIWKQLEFQKEKRDEIRESKEIVTVLEKENSEIRKQLLHNAQ